MLVKEMFTPQVDANKRQEVEIRQATTTNKRITTRKIQPPVQQEEHKIIPPEARGKVVHKERTGTATTKQPLSSKDNATLQFGNIRMIKSAKQVDEEREATIASWQARANKLLSTISQHEPSLSEDPLAPLFVRFTKHAMVSSMYCDTISAKLDLLTELCCK